MRELTTTLTDALLPPILERDPARPRITYYDDATGARIELSALTLANWAAKTANMIRDEFGLTPGARVAVLLPAHWQTAAVLLGVWWAGAEVVLDADPAAELAFVTPDRLDDSADIPEVAALSLDAMGRPVPDLPIGVTDYATSVRVHGDQFRASGAGAALAGRSVLDILDAAGSSAATQGFGIDDRVLSTADWTTPTDVVDGLIAVFAAGASLVQVANADQAALDRKATSEKVTVRRT
ncbi:TIGR03089 family protein [Antrihabitans cavernicola]|uniref:TIGR03089 family protein n=1 Tax=Antrihabitans cavernicola TaxID=2495913 RepID=A0A5A7SFK5_9NOCA|nr:TIGR03089 family protein [Spelaeibacter cavernicola]KAA0023962.1 TIGR03089 family protein [Spelaeibacter cavernicola]